MKKIHFILVSMILIFSCQKETKKLYNQELLKQDEQAFSKLRLNDQKINRIINLSQNEEDLKNRKFKRIIGKAFIKTFTNKGFISLLIDDAKKSRLKEANITRVLNENIDFLLELNKNIHEIDNNESFNSIVSKLEYKGTKLFPVIVIPNLDILDVNLMPIVSGGLDVEELTVDDILANFIFEDGTYKQILLNENEAVKLKKPVIIFAFGMNDENLSDDELAIDINQYYNYVDEEIDRDSSFFINSSLKSSGSKFQMLNIHTSIKSPNYFYEGSGYNEYFQSTILIQSNGTNNNQYYLSNYYHPNNSSNINLIKRFRIWNCYGQQFTTWDDLVNFANTSAPPTFWSGEDRYSSRTFERDWYGGNQSLGTTYYNPVGSQPTISKHMTGKMVYYNEWYVKNTSTFGKPSMWYYRDIQSYKSKCAQTRSH